MSLYTISDLHLPLGIDKPMDIFGSSWDNYVEKIADNWQSKIKDGDTVVLGGDFSWATYIEQAYKDFEFIEKLNGKKIILKGNHDYWWTTMNKMNCFLKDNGFTSFSVLQNNSFLYENIGICGTRGWNLENNNADDIKIYEREALRLEMSIQDALKNGVEELYVFMHYPPITHQIKNSKFHLIMKEHKVSKCIYGHLHSYSLPFAFTETYEGIEYILSSADYLKFNPILLKE